MSITPRSSRYGWKRDLPDFRDFKMTFATVIKLPSSVDLTVPLFPIFDQTTLGSCTGHAASEAYLFDCIKQGTVKLNPLSWTPSRLFPYYNTRAMEGTVNSDSGASIRDTVKCINKLGICSEALCPYVVSKFKVKPSKKAYVDGLKHQTINYQSVTQSLTQLKSCLAGGLPFVFGFTVYSSFETDAVAKTGVVPMPGKTESALGGHAVMCVGYSDITKRFKVQNSWGVGWGDKGYFYLPYDYLTNASHASDFWVIQKVEG